ncbi:MAG: hypothetical protein ACREQJ_08850 [Candidatus Binatia bacterium]
MLLLQIVGWFFSGAFLANAVPHFVMGATGRRFPTPFASPPGRGLSSPVVNVVWGFANLVVGILLAPVGEYARLLSTPGLATAAGFLLMGVFLAWHFGALEEPRS